jgi:hypothetical protein
MMKHSPDGGRAAACCARSACRPARDGRAQSWQSAGLLKKAASRRRSRTGARGRRRRRGTGDRGGHRAARPERFMQRRQRPGAPAVGTCSQPPSQDAPTSTPGTLGTLLMRYPSQTCVPLAPQRQNSLKVPSCGTGKTITTRPAGRMGLAALTSWPAEHGPGPHASPVRARPQSTELEVLA